MSDFITSTSTCQSCGGTGTLQITNDVERFACDYCRKERIVRRSGGTVSLAPVVDDLTRELAIKCLREDIPKSEAKKRDADQKFQAAINALESRYIIAKSQLSDLGKSVIFFLMVGFALVCTLYVSGVNWTEEPAQIIISIFLFLFALYSFFVGLPSSWIKRNILKEQVDRMEQENLIKIKILKKEWQTKIAEIEQELSSKQTELQKHEKMVSLR